MSQRTAAGDSVNFTCNAGFPAPSSYNWSTPISNSDLNTSTTTITVIASDSTFGNYTCITNSGSGMFESQPALLAGTCVATVYLYSCYLAMHY